MVHAYSCRIRDVSLEFYQFLAMGKRHPEVGVPVGINSELRDVEFLDQQSARGAATPMGAPPQRSKISAPAIRQPLE
jgi:hypothetical protein